MGQKRAGDDVRAIGAFLLHHHPARRAHHRRRRHPDDVPAGFADLRNVGGGVHGREQDEMIGGDGEPVEEAIIAGADIGVAVEPAPRHRDPEAGGGEPFQAVQRLRPGSGSPLRLVEVLVMMVEADPHDDPIAMLGADRGELSLEPPHRPHRVGEDEQIEAAVERRAHHRDHVGIHERLAAGESDHPRAQSGRLGEIGFGLGEGQIDEPVVGRRTEDVAAPAGEIAERAGVDPQGVEPFQGHRSALLALGGEQRIGELVGIERRRVGDRERRGGCSHVHRRSIAAQRRRSQTSPRRASRPQFQR